MSDLVNLEETRQTLRRLTVLALEANRALYDGLQTPDAEPSPERSKILNRILDELKPVREGFMLAIKASDIKLVSELHDMINYLMDWAWLEELGLSWTANDTHIERLSGQVVLYNHAIIALGVLPRLPENVITYPYGAYRDIPVPTTPGETLTRLQELESTIWKASQDPMSTVSRGAMRRTYGFFEATMWLVSNHFGKALGL
jgi:hypothetical protein